MSIYEYDNMLKITRTKQNVSILVGNGLFFDETGYKVLNNQGDVIFFRCRNSTYNGKLKFIYDVSSFTSLKDKAEMLSEIEFLNVLLRIADFFNKMDDIGFLDYECVLYNPQDVFLDERDNIFFIYVPVKMKASSDARENFNRDIRKSFLSLFILYDPLFSVGGKFLTDKRPMADCRNDIKALIDKREQPDIIVAESDKDDKEHKLSGVFGILKKPKPPKARTNDTDGEIAIKSVDNTEVFLPITKPSFVIGRNSEKSDGVITKSLSISREHCLIEYKNSSYHIRDLGSKYGTFVNGVELTKNKTVRVKPGDRIRLGDMAFIVVSR